MLPQWDPLHEMPSMIGKDVVVTGGYTGTGLSMTKFLALRGARVFLAVRSEEKFKRAADKLRFENPTIEKRQLEWVKLELGELETVISAAEELGRRTAKIDMLINNAAVCSSTTSTYGDGWEAHMAINYIGHFVFTNRLMPLLKAAAITSGTHATVVSLGSNATHAILGYSYPHVFSSPSCLKKPVPVYPATWRYIGRRIFSVDMVRYAVSKAAVALFSKELQRRMNAQHAQVVCICAHPGFVLSEALPSLGGRVYALMIKAAAVSTDEGAASVLRAALSKEVTEHLERYKGRYVEPELQIRVGTAAEVQEEQVQGLWENTTREVNRYLEGRGLPVLQEW